MGCKSLGHWFVNRLSVRVMLLYAHWFHISFIPCCHSGLIIVYEHNISPQSGGPRSQSTQLVGSDRKSCCGNLWFRTWRNAARNVEPILWQPTRYPQSFRFGSCIALQEGHAHAHTHTHTKQCCNPLPGSPQHL